MVKLPTVYIPATEEGFAFFGEDGLLAFECGDEDRARSDCILRIDRNLLNKNE
jgi:hypothetical protein